MFKASIILFLASLAHHAIHKAAATMSEFVWGPANAAGYKETTIEFCEEVVGRDTTYGYRLPSNTGTPYPCEPAGVVIRMTPGEKYILTLKNTASVATNGHMHGIHLSGAHTTIS